jgi:hypothetical protein
MTKGVFARSVIGIVFGVSGLILLLPCRDYSLQFFTAAVLILLCGFISWTLPKGNL